MFKTRSMASDACTGGHVKLNDETVKASKSVMIGDTVDVLTPGGPRVLEVAGLADKRGPAKVAVTLYVDHTPPPPPTTPLLRRGRSLRNEAVSETPSRYLATVTW